LKFTERFWNRIIRYVPANDRKHPLVVRDRVIDLFFAVGRSGGMRADHEDEIFGGLDVGEDFLLPLRRQRNVFPVDPGLALLSHEGIIDADARSPCPCGNTT
jgi:hypothetical protein